MADTDDWKLLDELLAVLRRRSYPPDEVIEALTTCLAKTIVMAGVDKEQREEMVETAGRSLSYAVNFQKTVTGED